MKKFTEGMTAPTIVLGVICLVISLALAVTYQITLPQIQAINEQLASATRAEVLEAAGQEGFAPIEGDLPEGVTEYYVASNGSGAVVTSQAKSFGGTITVMTGIDSQGAVTGVKVTNHADTPGLGTKAMTAEYLAQYNGISELDDVTTIKNDSKVDQITGATVSSNGVYACVKYALNAFKEVGGVQ